jgi:hypothetical protein
MTVSDEVKSKYFRSSSRARAKIPMTMSPQTIDCIDTQGNYRFAEIADFLCPSDSPLSDVPSDISSVVSSRSAPRPVDKTVKRSSTTSQTPEYAIRGQNINSAMPAVRKRILKVSPYFVNPAGDTESCLPFPSISATSFGLIQEQLASDPFRLLIATIFLNRTRGVAAIPTLFRLFEHYPTIQTLAGAELADVVSLIHCLGFQNQRAKKSIQLAKTWLAAPPFKGKRYRKLHYPSRGDGLDIGPEECIDDDDRRVGWEIAHLPGVGAYAIDSWRIFCRDQLRGLVMDRDYPGAMEGFFPEWKSVVPKDKELRAYITWMWLKEGQTWNYETGERTPAGDKLMRSARRGGVAYEEEGNWILEISPVKAPNGLHGAR